MLLNLTAHIPMCDGSNDFGSLFWDVRITAAEKCDYVAKIGQDWSGLMTSCLESSHEIDFGTKDSFNLTFGTNGSLAI